MSAVLTVDRLTKSFGALRVAVLNLVGMFYNTFMPGSTGGDLVKAYYASKHTPWRTRAVMSVSIAMKFSSSPEARRTGWISRCR